MALALQKALLKLLLRTIVREPRGLNTQTRAVPSYGGKGMRNNSTVNVDNRAGENQRSRLSLGEFTLKSKPGPGARVHVRAPLPKGRS